MKVVAPQDQRIPTEEAPELPPPQAQRTIWGCGFRIAGIGCGVLYCCSFCLLPSLSSPETETLSLSKTKSLQKKRSPRRKRSPQRNRSLQRRRRSRPNKRSQRRLISLVLVRHPSEQGRLTHRDGKPLGKRSRPVRWFKGSTHS